MPYDIRVVRSCDFVRLDAQGHFDLEATRQVFSEILWACLRSKLGRVLLDVRDAAAELSAAQLGSVANVCRGLSTPPDEHRIAILTSPGQKLARASLLSQFAQDAGWNVAPFSDFEDAFEWLSGGSVGRSAIRTSWTEARAGQDSAL